MDDDLQNPPYEVKRLLAYAQDSGNDVVYTYYEEKQHAAWRNLGSRFTNWCADRDRQAQGPLPLELPLHLRLLCARSPATRGRFPMSTG